jgi:4-aminobutyrate aminotransferase-like enzyme
VGDELRQSPAIRAAIHAIVSEVRTRAAKITGVRGAREELKETYEGYLKRATEMRGRAPHYPYLSSGVGHGALVELMDGSVKWDMISGIGVHFFGHSEPGIIGAAVEGAIADTVQNGNLQSDWTQYRFMETLLSLAGRGSRLKHGFATTSGCMANENALKICFQKRQPASRVLVFRDCFMGRSVTMTQLGDTAAYRVGVPLSAQVDYVPFYDEAAAAREGPAKQIDTCVRRLREYIDRYPGLHAAFVFELVQGEGGFNTAPREFFTALMDVCREAKIPVWDDEIQSFGRTETMFAYERLELGHYIDVLTVGKMTQACATLWTEEMNPGPGLISGTFTSSPVEFSVGTHVLERLRDGGYYGPRGSIARHHAAFVKQVRALAAKHPEWFPSVDQAADIVGGTGGMMRFTPFGGAKDRIMRACQCLFDEGVVAFYAGHGPYHVRFLPPLGVMDEKDWPKVFECVERGLAKAAA